ncbi:MAG: protein kinase [Deltaproteobacteria bacterium]|nr:protein kinase [Deltaproteobacteria bacterium]
MAAPESAHLPVGSLFNGHYEINRCIGQGGMGAVYEVVHQETQRRRALKVMLPSKVKREGLRERFKREATVVAGVQSEHIADVLDAGIDGESGSPFIVMELLEGEDLAAMLERLGTLPPVEVVRHLWQASLALDKTHAAGVVHRDLKPENLFVIARDDGSSCVKLLDFGLAKVVTGGSTGKTTKGIVGTLAYLAPEQVHGRERQSGQTDIYALAQIAYTLLTGTPFWNQAVADQNFYGVLVTVSEGAKQSARERAQEHCDLELPEAFDDWFSQATAVEPDDRHESCAALVASLAEVLDVELPRGAQRMMAEARASAASGPADGSSDSPAAGAPGRGADSGEPVRHDSSDSEVDAEPPAPSFAEAVTRNSGRTLGLTVVVAALVVAAGVVAVNVLDDGPAPSTAPAPGSAALTEAPSTTAAPSSSATVSRPDAPPPGPTASATASATVSAAAPPASSATRRPVPSRLPPRTSATAGAWTPPVTER